jgi:hypothetical protein
MFSVLMEMLPFSVTIIFELFSCLPLQSVYHPADLVSLSQRRTYFSIF